MSRDPFLNDIFEAEKGVNDCWLVIEHCAAGDTLVSKFEKRINELLATTAEIEARKLADRLNYTLRLQLRLAKVREQVVKRD